MGIYEIPINPHMKLYRYTTDGEGVWSAGKRLLPATLVEEASANRAWLVKPQLPKGEYRFYLTEKGKEQYERTLLNTHRKYLAHISCEEIDSAHVESIVYEDTYQVVAKAWYGYFVNTHIHLTPGA